jgi:CBS domain containing-hemolysin-like protein
VSTGWALLLSLLLLAANGFFVAAEFALVASRSYRLDQAVGEGRRGAKAALAGVNELSLMLAGAQLGITICTLGLGALAEPAVAHSIEPLLHRVGLPEQTSYLIAFAIALIIVVFLHMVIGEMAPKSWAISHPERSALLLAPIFVGFTRVVRPVIAALNAMANALLRLVRVEPQDRLAQAHGPEELAILLEQSREHGTIERTQHELLDSMLRLSERTIADIMQPIAGLITIDRHATADEVEEVCLRSGHSRIGVRDDDGRILGLVHVRDAIKATTYGSSAVAGDLMTPAFTAHMATNLIDTLAIMRDQRAQLAVVVDRDRPVGFLALEDLLEQVIGDFYDETDRPWGTPRARRA